jgi:hexosaminidase
MAANHLPDVRVVSFMPFLLPGNETTWPMKDERSLPAIIPRPGRLEPQPGHFTINSQTVVVTDEANHGNAVYLRQLLMPATGFSLPITGETSQENAIQLQITAGTTDLGAEGYHLDISPGRVRIESAGTGGIFYGIQSLRQMLPVEIEQSAIVPHVAWHLPAVFIEDSPRFAWRGLMVDEGRHFHGLETIKRTLDLMALQTLNVLHWHLTEDQGWRIEIGRYPRLTQIGSQRPGTSRRLFGRHDGIPHWGYYTHEQIREIVDYAAERQIIVVPEIEMPGHSLSALAAYPEYSCTGGPFAVATRFGIFNDIYCAGKEETYIFLQNVLDEIMALFPSRFIHIGGDEAPKRRWKACPDCQQRITTLGLRDWHGLSRYFTNRVVNYLAQYGRQAIGWNEILNKDLPQSAVLQYWLGRRKKVIGAMRAGREVILSSYWHLYLDHSYDLTPLSKTYCFEPVFAGLSNDEVSRVKGLEAAMWTEFVQNRDRLDYQLHPRLSAVAETGWSPADNQDFRDFRQRLRQFLPRLDELGVRYAPLARTEPPWYRQLLGIFTLAQAQRDTASTGASQPIDP